MRRVLSVAALSLVLAVNVSGVERDLRGGPKEPPLAKIVRFLKNAIRNLGDGLVTPRP